jgi:hypothetical protein
MLASLARAARSRALQRQPMASLARTVSSGKPTSAKYTHPPLVAQSGPESDVNLTEAMMRANPNKLQPERQDLIWDDGTARPEWYIDRECWSVSNTTAVTQLFGMLIFGFGGWLTFMYNFSDKVGYASPVVPRSCPPEYGLDEE